MFESGRFDSGLYNAQKDFLTWVVVVIIVVSVCYFVVVLLSEVHTMIMASSKRRKAPTKGEKGTKVAKVTQRTIVESAEAALTDSGELCYGPSAPRSSVKVQPPSDRWRWELQIAALLRTLGPSLCRGDRD